MAKTKAIYDWHENWELTHSEEYGKYMAALCRLASGYISKIRVKFATRAFEKYADPTIRKLVLAYGEECEKLDKDRLSDFRFVSENGPSTDWALKDSVLNHSSEYGRAIWFLFGIDDDKEEKKDGKD